MKWFIKKNLFSYVQMRTVRLVLGKIGDRKGRTIPAIDGRPLDCIIVQSLDSELKKEIEKAIGRMDIKPYFTIREIEARLEKGYFFSIGMIDGQVVGWTWAGVDEVYFSDFDSMIHLKKKDAFSYNTFVDKDFRGREVNQYILTHLLYELQKSSFEKIWGLIYPWNTSSLKSYANNGWDLLGYYRFIKLCGLNIHLPPKSLISLTYGNYKN